VNVMCATASVDNASMAVLKSDRNVRATTTNCLPSPHTLTKGAEGTSIMLVACVSLLWIETISPEWRERSTEASLATSGPKRHEHVSSRTAIAGRARKYDGIAA
jgi:hypothetical protein